MTTEKHKVEEAQLGLVKKKKKARKNLNPHGFGLSENLNYFGASAKRANCLKTLPGKFSNPIC